MAEVWERLGKPRREVRPFNVLLAVTGSVAAIKVEELVAKIRQVQDEVLDSAMDECECGTADTTEGEDGKGEVSGLREEAWKFTSSIEVKVVATDAGRKFLPEPGSAGSKALDTATQLFDEDEWRSWREKGDPVLHIDLRKWADMMLVAPLSANTLAKVANGMCDNLVTCVARAWDFKGAPDNLEKPLVVAPAMNTCMWEHPITEKQLKALDDLGVWIVPPQSKTLACGDVGMGAMASTDVLCDVIQHCFEEHLHRHSAGSLGRIADRSVLGSKDAFHAVLKRCGKPVVPLFGLRATTSSGFD